MFDPFVTSDIYMGPDSDSRLVNPVRYRAEPTSCLPLAFALLAVDPHLIPAPYYSTTLLGTYNIFKDRY